MTGGPCPPEQPPVAETSRIAPRRGARRASIRRRSSATTAKGRLADARGPRWATSSPYAAPTLAKYVTGRTAQRPIGLWRRSSASAGTTRCGWAATTCARPTTSTILVLGALQRERLPEGHREAGRGTLRRRRQPASPCTRCRSSRGIGSAAGRARRDQVAPGPGRHPRGARIRCRSQVPVMRNGDRVYHAAPRKAPLSRRAAAGPRPFAVDALGGPASAAGVGLTDQSPLAVPVGDPYTPSSAFHAPPPPLALAHQPKPLARRRSAQRPTNVEWWPHAKVGLTDPEAAGVDDALRPHEIPRYAVHRRASDGLLQQHRLPLARGRYGRPVGQAVTAA